MDISYLDVALSYCIRGDFVESKKILDRLDQNDLRVKFNLGWHYLREGNLSKGYEYLNYGRWLNSFGNGKIPTTASIYKGEEVKNKTILLQGEGGKGDEIINIRFGLNFYNMGAKVIIGCDKSLFSLFSKLPWASGLIDTNTSHTCYHDYWVPAMSAAYVLGLEYKDIHGEPYLNYFEPHPVLKSKKFKVGIKWSGNPEFEHQQHRVFPKKLIIDLHTISENVEFYSLQKDEDLVENLPFTDLRKVIKTWEDTARIISGLDLVITSCTSVAHLAGAMGKPTWVIVPILPYYIWSLPGNKSPWYNSVTIYRQTKFKEWNDVFKRIEQDLKRVSNTSIN